ncbi:MAG: beta-galactosidase [Lachnospiraceae bacterium]|nr:beta-galactosidase [Lachnospiraceae bacterium]
MIIVLSLYIFAYFFGKHVVAPRRNASPEPTGEAKPVTALKDGTVLPAAVLAGGAAKNGKPVPVSVYAELEGVSDPGALIDSLKKAGAAELMIPLAWSLTEPAQGMATLSRYEAVLDRLAAEGFRFVFLLDAGGRPLNLDGTAPKSSIPAWVFRQASVALDCYGKYAGEEGTLCYSDPKARELYTAYAEAIIKLAGERYGDKVVGFAPAVTPELTVAYPKSAEAWFDFSEAAEESFRAYLRSRYGTIEQLNQTCGCSYVSFSQITLPTGMLAPNSIANGALNEAAVYPDYQLFRENELAEFVKPVFEIIRKEGYVSAARFGTVLSVTDGAGANGIAAKLADFADRAVIAVSAKETVVPAMISNYMKTAGYREVYLEPDGSEADLQQAFDYAAEEGSLDGALFKGSVPALTCGVKTRGKADIAIYAGEWNFYRSQGETEAYEEYFTDSVSQMYKIIRFELNRNADLITDAQILSGDLNKYKLVILPGQFYVSDEAVKAVEAYAKQGGAVLQDYRFGEWDAYGANRGAWSDETFGIAARSATLSEVKISGTAAAFAGISLTVKPVYNGVPNLFGIAGTDGAVYLFEDGNGSKYGIRKDKAVCLCFQPQLIYKYANDAESRELSVRIIKYAAELLLGEQ